MSMNQSKKLSAYDVVNSWPYKDLVKILFTYGEEKFSKQIARRIEKAREVKDIQTTFELVELIKDAIPAPARRRSEEHTSELQSRGQLVCRLLLEKKNK